MTRTEDVLKRALTTYADATEVSPDALEHIAARRSRRRGWLRRHAVTLGVATASLALLVGALVVVSDPAPDSGADVVARPAVMGPIDRWREVRLDGLGPLCEGEVTPGCSRLVGALARGDGFLVVGNDGGTPLAYVSQDGRSWAGPVRLPVPPGRSDAVVEAVTSDGERFVAVGSARLEGLGGGPTSGVAWVSQDGLRWDLADLGPLADASVSLTDVARFGGGFVATALLGRGDADVDLAVVTSEEGRRWGQLGLLGGPMPAGQTPVVGVESGAGVLVYAAVGTADESGCLREGGLATWTGDKDGRGLALFRNSDDPGRPDVAVASPGLESAVLPTCGQVQVTHEPAGGAGATGTFRVPSLAGPGVTWDGDRPVLYAFEPTGPEPAGGGQVPEVLQRRFVSDGGAGWLGEDIPVVDDATGEVVVDGAGTSGYRLAVATVDGRRRSQDGGYSAEHRPGDGTGFGLELLVDEGAGWQPVEQDGGGQEFGALAPDTCGDPWGTSAYGVAAIAANTRYALIVGAYTPCLQRHPDGRTPADELLRPAVWIGPLP